MIREIYSISASTDTLNFQLFHKYHLIFTISGRYKNKLIMISDSSFQKLL